MGALVALAAFQADDANTKYLKEKGFSIQKPKKDEWQFQNKGNLTRSQLIIKNVVSDASIEMYSEPLNENKLKYDLKGSLELLWKEISTNGDYKNVSQVGKIWTTDLPGKGLAGQKVWLLDMTVTFPSGKPMEWKSYCFQGRENRSIFFVNVVTKEGDYAKHKTDLEWMLSTIKTYRIPKD
jgi:hypothetical protein